MAKRKNIIRRKDLIKMVAESSGYHNYQVDDILKHFFFVMQQQLLQDNDVQLDGIGIVGHVQKKPRTWYNALTGRVNTTDRPTHMLALRMGDEMLALFRETHDAAYLADQQPTEGDST